MQTVAIKTKPKPNATTLEAFFSRAWQPLHIFTGRSDWFSEFVLTDKLRLLSSESFGCSVVLLELYLYFFLTEHVHHS